jgi:putative flippase GtrA
MRRLLPGEFVRFCAVGASGYAVIVAVYAALTETSATARFSCP